MPHFVLKDARVMINSVNLSSHVQSVTVTHEAEIKEANVMGIDSRQKLPGLKNWTATLALAQDFSTGVGAVDKTLFPLVGSTDFPVAIRPTSAIRSASNPEFSGRGLLASYPPLGNTVGDLATASVTIEGTGDLSRLTSST